MGWLRRHTAEGQPARGLPLGLEDIISIVEPSIFLSVGCKNSQLGHPAGTESKRPGLVGAPWEDWGAKARASS